MIQIFFQAEKITQNEWSGAYQRIESIVKNFPIKLIRVIGHDGWSNQLDTLHFDLYISQGNPDERICFFSDWITLIPGVNAKFYKNWDFFVKERLEGTTKNADKPITWYPPTKFEDDGSLCTSNGAVYKQSYLDVEGAPYEFAVLAIGIMLENLLPGKVFMTADSHSNTTIENTVDWLAEHFNEYFEKPIYFEKKRLLESFINEYDDKKEAACRMEHLFRKQYKRNIEFAIKNIGYEPTFRFYAEVLTVYRFGTFGFADVLQPWIAVTKHLESALELIAASKKLLLYGNENFQNPQEADKYDLTSTLQSFLNEHILWTPVEREALEHFYTNKQALEEGNENLWGSIMRMTGTRVDICPMYATADELFEAFMYHDPKNGIKYKNIIDNWMIEHADDYAEFKRKLAAAENALLEQRDENTRQKPTDTSQNVTAQIAKAKDYIKTFSLAGQYFIEAAITMNPYFTQVDDLVETTREKLANLTQDEKLKDLIEEISAESENEKKAFIKYRLKKLRMSLSVNPNFEQWLDQEQDENVLFNLRLLAALKFYNLFQTYARFRIFWDRGYWDYWRALKISQ